MLQYYEDVLPYQDFSVRLSNEDIPRLGDILRAIDDSEYGRLQQGLLRSVNGVDSLFCHNLCGIAVHTGQQDGYMQIQL